MNNYFNLKKMKTGKALLLVLTLLCVTVAKAQQRYTFRAQDYVSTDNNRAPQSAFSYDASANTLTITASGTNNIAFQMDKAQVDGRYFVLGDQQYYVVEGTNLKATPATNSYVWWFNGANKGTQEASTMSFDTDHGTTIVVWNIAENEVMRSNMNFAKEPITIGSNGAAFINALGLTSSTGTSTIRNIDYLEKYGMAALYPCTWDRLGYTAESLTSEIAGRIDTRIGEAERKLQTGTSEELAKALDEARKGKAALTATSYSEAYKVLRRLEDVLLTASITVGVSSVESIEGGLHITQDKLHTYILFYNNKVVRVLKSHAALAAIDKLSMSVIKDYDKSIALTYDGMSGEGDIKVSSQDVTICISRKDGHISALRADGTPLVREKTGGTMMEERSGVTPYDTYTIRTTFALDSDECVYGLGQIQNGDLNQRNKTILLEQDNMKVCIPFFQSTKGYGIFWDNYSPTTWCDDAKGTYFESTGSEIDYYILAGDPTDDVVTLTRWLTGEAPLMPLWNFGLYQSKERYRSATETMNVIREYRKRQVPIDCVVQDWQYWGEENDHRYWNSLYFLNKTYFSNYQEMIDDVHANNAHLLISIWGNFGYETPAFKELQALGRMIPANSYPWDQGVQPYDVWSTTARDIYWKHLYEGLVSKGVDAYWMDSTEPDYQKKSDSELDYISENGRSWRTMRNSFVLGHISGVYDHHRALQASNEQLAGKRVSILTRSGFVGQQRYAAQTWSGDISASWETLQKQIPAALNFTACGIPYWNNDNGAFFVGYKWGSNGPFNDDNYRNLYLRWTQFSTFTGMMRFHGSGHNCEIWQLGEESDTDGHYAQVLKYIRMRYRMLPYLYSFSWQVSQNHRTLMTALPLAFPGDKECRDKKYEYMFGDAMLVCPVVNEGQTITHNYLPAGTQWVDFWTGETLQGGTTHTKQANLDIIPLYIKAGSILPWGPDVQYSTEKKWDNLEIRIYPGADGDFTLYEDENDNYNYENGAYTEIPMHWDNESKTLTIGARRGNGFEGMLANRSFSIVMVNPLRGAGDAHCQTYSATVQYDGSETSVVLSDQFSAEQSEDVTSQYIVNPSFEDDVKGWTRDINTTWSGVNVGGGTGDPQATDGTHIFGVWDANVGKKAMLSQPVTLPRGSYRLTVDMHAPDNNASRLGDQHLFCGDKKALLRDQVSSTGRGDMTPLQTIALEFDVAEDGTTLNIGVNQTTAPTQTWYKVDNFRLIHISEKAELKADNVVTSIDNVPTDQPAINSGKKTFYSLSGMRLAKPQRGINIVSKGGKTQKVACF